MEGTHLILYFVFEGVYVVLPSLLKIKIKPHEISLSLSLIFEFLIEKCHEPVIIQFCGTIHFPCLKCFCGEQV